MKMSHLFKQTFQPSIKFTSSLTFYSLQTLCRLLVGKEISRSVHVFCCRFSNFRLPVTKWGENTSSSMMP